MTATAFTLTSLESGRLPGFGLVCPEALYSSVRVLSSDVLQRRWLGPADWRSVESELRDRLPPTPLERSSSIVRALVESAGVMVQYTFAVPIDAPPTQTAEVLDTYLRSIPTA